MSPEALLPHRRDIRNRLIRKTATVLLSLAAVTELTSCTASGAPRSDSSEPSAVVPHNDPTDRIAVLQSLNGHGHDARVDAIDLGNNDSVALDTWGALHAPPKGNTLYVTFDGKSIDQLSMQAGQTRDMRVPQKLFAAIQGSYGVVPGVLRFENDGSDCGYLEQFQPDDPNAMAESSNCANIGSSVQVVN